MRGSSKLWLCTKSRYILFENLAAIENLVNHVNLVNSVRMLFAPESETPLHMIYKIRQD